MYKITFYTQIQTYNFNVSIPQWKMIKFVMLRLNISTLALDTALGSVNLITVIWAVELRTSN